MDYLYGSRGSDTLDGGAGNDFLSGGDDADFFRYGTSSGADRVSDFQNDEDTLQFHGFDGILTDAASALSFATDIGSSVTFDFGNGNMLLVFGMTKALLLDDIEIL